jgi:hypothetical protein
MANRNGWVAPALAAVIAFTHLPVSGAAECRLESSAHRVTVVELYTSEGCSSCPPADRWFSKLAQQGISADMAVLLAFHVDYWNQLGWPDRFSRPQFSDRQREVAARTSSDVIYTPQLVVDGKDLRHGYNVDRLRAKLTAINQEKAHAKIRATVNRSDAELRISGEVELFDSPGGAASRTWVALFENGLSSRVTAGENTGKHLGHDYVVRELAGPFSRSGSGRIPLEQRIKIQPDWNIAQMGIAIFVERAATGEVLEAAAQFPLCSS